jgi:hypothetical protein
MDAAVSMMRTAQTQIAIEEEIDHFVVTHA